MGGIGVSVGSTGVSVGATGVGVDVGGTGVSVGGMGVGVSVGQLGGGVPVDGSGVTAGVGVGHRWALRETQGNAVITSRAAPSERTRRRKRMANSPLTSSRDNILYHISSRLATIG